MIVPRVLEKERLQLLEPLTTKFANLPMSIISSPSSGGKQGHSSLAQAPGNMWQPPSSGRGPREGSFYSGEGTSALTRSVGPRSMVPVPLPSFCVLCLDQDADTVERSERQGRDTETPAF